MALFRATPTLSEEVRAWRAGLRHVAGIDEAGRGPMAGPVVAAAVVLDPQWAAEWWSELRDSKQLTNGRRTALAERLRAEAAYGVGTAGHDEIDADGLIEATRRAMWRAVDALPREPDLLLIDALSLTKGGYNGRRERSIVHGDALCVSIAAASVVAKDARDRLMDGYDTEYPEYGFGHNRGYCTADHLSALAEHGPCPIHRHSFAPVRDFLEQAGQ